MARSSPQTLAKRQREQAKREKRRTKDERRAARKAVKKAGKTIASPGIDDATESRSREPVGFPDRARDSDSH